MIQKITKEKVHFSRFLFSDRGEQTPKDVTIAGLLTAGSNPLIVPVDIPISFQETYPRHLAVGHKLGKVECGLDYRQKGAPVVSQPDNNGIGTEQRHLDPIAGTDKRAGPAFGSGSVRHRKAGYLVEKVKGRG